MAKPPTYLLILLLTLLLSACFTQGLTTQVHLQLQQAMHMSLQGSKSQGRRIQYVARRLMIGSTAPTCTYNECRGCKFRCRAEQIPVDANDPINSAYHYKCVCHR